MINHIRLLGEPLLRLAFLTFLGCFSFIFPRSASRTGIRNISQVKKRKNGF